MPGFLPSTHGLRFANRFPPGPTLRLGPIDPRWIGIGDASAGLCGGMSWFVRERFEADCRAADTEALANGSPSSSAVRRQSCHSTGSDPLRFWWMGAMGSDGRYATWDVEWPRIRADIDAGQLAMVGLVRVRRNPFHLTQSHQVLAYAYGFRRRSSLRICDRTGRARMTW